MKKTSQISYFAAANSYTGFISFFKETFSSEQFKRIYVLKGGPGTGKSSLMKKIALLFYNEGYNVEKIHCSSDPNSLDGVIIKGNTEKIAILDGTAPHERDAIVPGAIDEIVNLGENLQKDLLSAEREKILNLTKEKSSAYKTAYWYLKTAGKNHEYISSVEISNFDKSRAKCLAENYFQCEFDESNKELSKRIISSFGKNGIYMLPLPNEEITKTITVRGSETSSSLFLNELLSLAYEKSSKVCIYKNALDQKLIDALRINDKLFIVSDENTADVDSTEFSGLSSLDKERIKAAEYMKNVALEEAVRWFNVASNIHFRLEEIYGRAMNFEKNDDVVNKLIDEIKNIL